MKLYGKIFIAAKRKPGGPEIRAIVKQFTDRNYDVVSRWCFEEYSSDHVQEEIDEIIEQNYRDIDRSHVFILICDGRDILCPGGKHVEFGYAAARGLKMIIIGPSENIYCRHSKVSQFDSLDDLFRELDREK